MPARSSPVGIGARTVSKKDLEHQIEVLKEAKDFWQAQSSLLASWLMSEWVHVNESKVGELDEVLRQYVGGRHGS